MYVHVFQRFDTLIRVKQQHIKIIVTLICVIGLTGLTDINLVKPCFHLEIICCLLYFLLCLKLAQI